MQLSQEDKLIKQERPCPEHLDSSMGSSVDECARKFYFRFIRGIVPLYEPDYFISGRAWDAGRGAWEEPGEEAIRYANAMQAINKIYDTCRCNFFKDQRTRENLWLLLSKYVEQNPPDSSPYQVLASNVGFEVPYKDFIMSGEMDRYVEWEPYGVVVDEDKTTMIAPEAKGWANYARGFDLGRYANQLTHYDWAAKQYSENVWGTRVLIACLDIPKRATTVRTLFQPLWKQRANNVTEDYLSLCELRMEKIRSCWKKWSWPRQGQQCTGGWGFSACEYQALCLMPVPLHKLEIPSNLYLIGEPWAPWKGIKDSRDLEAADGQVI